MNIVFYSGKAKSKEDREKVKQIDELLDGYEKENAEELVADIRKISDEIIEEL